MEIVSIVDATLQPWGKFGGALKEHSAVDLAALVIRELIERNEIEPGEIDNVSTCLPRTASAGTVIETFRVSLNPMSVVSRRWLNSQWSPSTAQPSGAFSRAR